MSRAGRFIECADHGVCAADGFGDCIACIQDMRVATGRCACGCGERLPRPNARSHSAACRSRAWKARTGYREPQTGKVSRNASPRKRRPAAPRLSYQKAVVAIRSAAMPLPFERAALAALEQCLPPSARRAA